MRGEIAYVDEARLQYFSAQGINPVLEWLKSGRMTLRLPVAKLSFDGQRDAHSSHHLNAKADKLVKDLKNKELIYEGRPSDAALEDGENYEPFVIEESTFCQMQYHFESLKEMVGFSSMKVWFSEKPYPVSVPDDIQNIQSDLILAQNVNSRVEVFNREPISARSALQMLVNMQKGRPLYNRFPGKNLNRDRDKSIRQALSDLGFIMLAEKRLKVLYRIRYFSKEKMIFKYRSLDRGCDILGYPIIMWECMN